MQNIITKLLFFQDTTASIFTVVTSTTLLGKRSGAYLKATRPLAIVSVLTQIQLCHLSTEFITIFAEEFVPRMGLILKDSILLNIDSAIY